jgi:hypothetical protein
VNGSFPSRVAAGCLYHEITNLYCPKMAKVELIKVSKKPDLDPKTCIFILYINHLVFVHPLRHPTPVG